MRYLILGAVGGAALLQTRAALPGDALMAGVTCAAAAMLLAGGAPAEGREGGEKRPFSPLCKLTLAGLHRP